jgi:hypothetical protein
MCYGRENDHIPLLHKVSSEAKQGVCVSHCGLAIYIKKYLKAKERRNMETQIFQHAIIYQSSKISSKRKSKSFKML